MTDEFGPLHGQADVGDDQVFVSMVVGEAEGAIPNGTTVVKVRDDPADRHTIGDKAIVLSSFGPTREDQADMPGFEGAGEFAYFVEWDDLRGVPIFIRGNKIKEA